MTRRTPELAPRSSNFYTTSTEERLSTRLPRPPIFGLLGAEVAELGHEYECVVRLCDFEGFASTRT
ncbi:UNVERIFIED_CONTAM: hypothetical protein NCL1_51095 [Trichonephila clavipes]